MVNLDKIRSDKIKNIIFVSGGGIGKVIASTAVVKRLSEEFPDKRIIVVTGYPDLFLYNPKVYKVFNFDNPLYFYDDYVTSESYIIKVEPYINYNYLFENKHLIDVWCESIGISSEGAEPELYFLDNELEAGKFYVDKLTKDKKKKFILFQWIGGKIPEDKSKEAMFEVLAGMPRRSLPFNVAQKIVDKLVARDFVVGVVQHENYPEVQGGVRIFLPIRKVIILLRYSAGFIAIDSFLHHAAVPLKVKGIVVWGGTNPKKLGYDLHENLTREVCPKPFCHRPNSFIFDTNPLVGLLWGCPFNTKCMEYDADEIINAYEKIMGE